MSYLHYLCLFGSSLPPVVCRRAHVLFMLFVFVRFIFTSSFCRRAHVLFTLFVFHCIRCPHILHCIFLCLVYPMLPVSLNCPFLIAPSIFFNVYISTSHQATIFKEYSSFPIHVLTKCIKKICHNYVTLAHVIVNTNIASYNIYYYKWSEI